MTTSEPAETRESVPRAIRFWRSAPVVVCLGILCVGLAYGWFPLVAAFIGKDRSPPVVAFLYFGSTALALALYAFFTRVVERRRERDELRWRDAPPMLPLGVAVGATFMCVVVGSIAALGGYRIDGYHALGTLWFPLALSIWSGIVEELLFRGVVFRVIERRHGSWIALAFSAALFGAVHLMNPNASLLSAVAIALEAGLMLGACFMAFRTLWVPMGLHMAWNFVQGGVFGIAVSGQGIEGLLASSSAGPEWLTGGDFGAEASVSAVVFGILLFAFFLARARRLGRLVSRAEAREQTAREYRDAVVDRATL